MIFRTNSIKQIPIMHTPMHAGFSLLELLIVLSILAVLTMFGYPSYQNHVKHTHRVAIKAELQEIAGRIETQKMAVNRYDKILVTDILDNPKSVGEDDFDGAEVENKSVFASQEHDRQTLNKNLRNTIGFYSLYPSAKKALYRIRIHPTSKNGEYIASDGWQVVAMPIKKTLMADDGNLVLTHEGVICHASMQDNKTTC